MPVDQPHSASHMQWLLKRGEGGGVGVDSRLCVLHMLHPCQHTPLFVALAFVANHFCTHQVSDFPHSRDAMIPLLAFASCAQPMPFMMVFTPTNIPHEPTPAQSDLPFYVQSNCASSMTNRS